MRAAVELANEGLISRVPAQRFTPSQIDFFLHPQLAADDRKRATAEGRLLATGSPGAAVGIAVFDPNVAQPLASAHSDTPTE